jgi:arylsulfatase A-like enzyme
MAHDPMPKLTTLIQSRWLLFLVAWAGLDLAGSGFARSALAPAKPNFLVIVADDMGFADAGCYGGEIATPNLDRLARRGLRFTQCYSTARCWPSRACLLTGYYAQQTGMDPPQARGPSWVRVLPHYLQPLGYRSYHSGKWHLMIAPQTLRDGGFDRSYRVEDHDRYFAPQRAFLNDQLLPPVPKGSNFYLTTAIADHAINFLHDHAEHHSNHPFFLFLAFTAPHFPLQALPQDVQRYKNKYLPGWDSIREQRWRRQRADHLVAGLLPPAEPSIIASWSLSADELRDAIGPGEINRAVPWLSLTRQQQQFQAAKMAVHAAMIDRMDREIGRVLSQLKSMGMFENTVIFFVSDNGASAEQIVRGDKHQSTSPPGSAQTFLCLGPGWSTAANTPFRLHKSWVHEGGISSPLIVHWPAGIRDQGALRRQPVHFIDLAPTLVQLAGGQIPIPHRDPEAPPWPGLSWVPLFERDRVLVREFLFFQHLENRALRVGDWKIVAAGTNASWELYNLANDRTERTNLASANPDVLRELAARWSQQETQFRNQAATSEAPR